MATASRFLPEHRRAELRALARRSHEVVFMAALTGAVVGLVVAGFDRLVVHGAFDHVLELPAAAMAAMPAVGLVLANVVRRTLGGGVSPATSDEYLRAFHEPTHRLTVRAMTARLVAAVATLGSGAPMGLEGPSLYAGAAIGANVQRRFGRAFRQSDRRLLLVAGAAAGVAAIFKAPATGAVFALEVPFRGDLARRMLLPALVASASGYLAFAAVNGTEPLFPIPGAPEFNLRDLVGVAALGVVCGIGARLFGWLLRRAKRVAADPRRAFLATIAAGAAIAGLVGLGHVLTGDSLVLGSGYRLLEWAREPDHSVWLLVAMLGLRCLATTAAVAGGGVGGLFIPLVVAGSLTGAAVGGLVNEADAGLFIVIGIAAFLGAGYRVPLAGVMFVAETTGRPAFVVPGLIAAVAAELVMGQSSITEYQADTTLRPDPWGT